MRLLCQLDVQSVRHDRPHDHSLFHASKKVNLPHLAQGMGTKKLGKGRVKIITGPFTIK